MDTNIQIRAFFQNGHSLQKMVTRDHDLHGGEDTIPVRSETAFVGSVRESHIISPNDETDWPINHQQYGNTRYQQ